MGGVCGSSNINKKSKSNSSKQNAVAGSNKDRPNNLNNNVNKNTTQNSNLQVTGNGIVSIRERERERNVGVSNNTTNLHKSRVQSNTRTLNTNNIDRNEILISLNNNNLHPIDTFSSRNIQPLDNNANSISINEEYSSRRNQLGLANHTNTISTVNPIPITLRNILEDSPDHLQHFCSVCSRAFRNGVDYHQHLSHCSGLRNNQVMHNSISEILQLVQSLNRQLHGENSLNIMGLFGQEEPEETSDYTDWRSQKLEDGSVIWKNQGRVHLTKEELNRISPKPSCLVVKEKYYLKRIWFLKYINKKIYDRSGSNTTLVVSRSNVLEESFNQFMTTHELDLKKEMQIFFVDEVAHDVGGVYREWFTSLFDVLFSPEQNFFYAADDKCVGKNSFFIPSQDPRFHEEDFLSYYEFIGKIIAKAVFDKMMIKPNFNIILIKHILRLKITLEDLKYFDSGYYNSLKSILTSKIPDNSDLYFTWNVRKYHVQMEVELIPDGADIMLTEQNKHIFIERVVDLICYTSIKEKVDALVKGFSSLIPHEIVSIFTPEEFDFLLSGQSNIDINDWKANTVYKGFYDENHIILHELTPENLLLFFKFCTGCTRVPIDGFNSLQGTRNKYQKFCIESPAINEINGQFRLIEAKTCFNRICVPNYESKEYFRKVVNTIIDYDTNFFGKQ